MESIAVSKAFASRHRYEVDANQELIGLGLANLAGVVDCVGRDHFSMEVHEAVARAEGAAAAVSSEAPALPSYA